jgi:hypothetical protein
LPSNFPNRYLILLIAFCVVAAQRKALLEMRSKYEIGDDAFHQIEAQLDVAEVNAQGAEYPVKRMKQFSGRCSARERRSSVDFHHETGAEYGRGSIGEMLRDTDSLALPTE